MLLGLKSKRDGYIYLSGNSDLLWLLSFNLIINDSRPTHAVNIQGLVMLQNSVIQMSTAKLVGATVLSNSILVITGIVIWQFWRNKQTQLQVETDGLTDEVKQIKEQLIDLQASKNKSPSDKASSGEGKNSDDTGLFEFLIEDNIQLRKQG